MGCRGAPVKIRMPSFWSEVAKLKDRQWQAEFDNEGAIFLRHPTLGRFSVGEVCRIFKLPARDAARVSEAGNAVGERHARTRRKLCRSLGLKGPIGIRS